MKGGTEKNDNLGGDLKSSCHRYLSVVLTAFLVSTKLCKMKYDFEGLISTVDLGFFLLKNQLTRL